MVVDSLDDVTKRKNEIWLYYDQIYQFCRKRVGAEEGKDLVQDVFLRATKYLNNFDPKKGNLKSWLYAIARSVVANYFNTKSNQKLEDVVAECEWSETLSSNNVSELDVLSNKILVEKALNLLGADHRYVITEILLRGIKPRELALELGVPESTIRTRLFYGLKAMKVTLMQVGWANVND